MPYVPPPDLAALSLSDIAALVDARKLPPITQWQPAQTGDSRMRIAADGRWYHDGGEIRRPAMVRAFSSLLMRDADGSHWLITPPERLAIAVEDAAFIAIDVKQEGDALVFRLNTDEFVVAGPDHPIRARGDRDTPGLYVAVRHGTEARLNRSTYAQLIDMALATDDPAGSALTVRSQGQSYPLIPG